MHVNRIIVIALKGNVSMVVAANSGWKRFGFEHTITKVDENIVYEIDHKPALDFYKEYLGNESDKLPASGLHFPFCIISSDSKDQDIDTSGHLVRTILGIDQNSHSLIFAGSIPLNSKVDIMKSTHQDLIASAEKNQKSISESLSLADNVDTFFSLIVSCVGRRLAVGMNIVSLQ